MATFVKNVKVITGELQHNIMIADIDKKQENRLEARQSKTKCSKNKR